MRRKDVVRRIHGLEETRDFFRQRIEVDAQKVVALEKMMARLSDHMTGEHAFCPSTDCYACRADWVEVANHRAGDHEGFVSYGCPVCETEYKNCVD